MGGRLGGRWLASWARFGLLHHPDPVLCSTIFGVCQGGKDAFDKPQKSLRAAWIGVMQKDWIPQEMQRAVARPRGSNDAAGRVPTPGESSGCGVLRRLEFVAEFTGP